MDNPFNSPSHVEDETTAPNPDTRQPAENGGDSSVLGHVLSVRGGQAQALARLPEVEIAGGEDGRSLLGQIGTFVKMRVGDADVYASIREVRPLVTDGTSRDAVLELDFIGEAQVDKRSGELEFSRGISRFPIPSIPVKSTNSDDLIRLFAPRDGVHLRIGTIYPTRDVPASLNADYLLSKHFAVLGSTGTGKSSALALIIHRLVEQLPHGHILILDPHDEYGEACSDIGVQFNTENFALPYWLMNLEEHIEVFVGRHATDREIEIDILKRCLFAARKKGATRQLSDRMTVDTPVPYKLTDLLHEIEGQMGRLEKPEKVIPFLRLKTKIEELKNDQRYGFMFSGLLISDSLPEIISRVLRFPSDGKPVSILDLSGVPGGIVDVVVSVLSRMVFDFAVWSRKEAASRPLLLICEEAHRYVPEAGRDEYGSARKSLERIAKEGRKYGVSLGLVSQRPSDLSEAVLSQCGTILSMRMNNDRDRRYVESAMPEGSTGFLESLPSLQKRECIISGEGVSAPLRVKLDFLPAAQRPSSDDPDFSMLWRHEVDDVGFVRKVIERWRRQQR